MHRTLTFYLGLLPIVILLWAWADSVKHGISWNRSIASDDAIWVQFGNSKFIFGRTTADGSTGVIPQTPPYGLVQRVSAMDLNPFGEPTPIFPALRRDFNKLDFQSTALVAIRRDVPIWLILACYLPLWLVLSWWHSRRRSKRIAASLPAPQPRTT